jgi:hypothetical protein
VESGPFTATPATTDEEVARLAGDWEVLHRSLEASPFVGPTLYRAWHRELGKTRSPFVVAVRDGTGALRAVAPWAGAGHVVYSVPGHVKVAGELLCSIDDGPAAWRAVLEATFRARGVLLAVVPHATDDERGLLGAAAAARELSLPFRALPRFRRFRLQLDGLTWEDHLARWSPKTRASLRYTQNRLSREGALRFEEVAGADGYERLRELHLRQWTPARTISWVHLDAGARIDRELLADTPAKVLLLFLDERPIVASLYLDSGARRTFLYTTRDESIRRTTPGQLMHAEKIRRALADGIREIDLMGEGGHKERYALDEHIGYELLIGRRGPLGRGAVAARRAQIAARRLASSLRR